MSDLSRSPAHDAAPNLAAAAQLLQMGEGIIASWALYVAARLGIADLMADGSQTTDDLARMTGAHPAALYRVLRFLGMLGVVTEVEPHRFGLTALGECLRTSAAGSLRSWFIMNGPIYRVFADAPLDSVLTGKPAFEKVLGAGFFEYAARDPEWGEAFNSAMEDVGRQTAHAVVEAYDFSGIGRIVDVGGGHGTLLTAILQAHPELTGVLFDLPRVTEGAASKIAEAGLAGRCEVVGGDFFESVPAGGDAYVLSWVIHDWDDDHALNILRNCRRAIRDSGRLLLVEANLPAGDEPHFAKQLDMAMLVALGGQERTETEYANLMTAAGFGLSRVLETASPMSVFECAPVGSQVGSRNA
jgi:SAM-dependent methyltransferase